MTELQDSWQAKKNQSPGGLPTTPGDGKSHNLLDKFNRAIRPCLIWLRPTKSPPRQRCSCCSLPGWPYSPHKVATELATDSSRGKSRIG
jgi:hypothetical protein